MDMDMEISYPRQACIPPIVQLYVGRRDVTDQLEFRHGATLTGAVLGMRRIDFWSSGRNDVIVNLNECDGTVMLLHCMITMRLSVRNCTLCASFIQFIQDAQKTGHIASRQTFHRDAGQTG